MFGRRYFGGRYLGARYFGDGGTGVVVDGSYNGSRYFGPRFFGPRYFSTVEGAPVGPSDIVPQPLGEIPGHWKLDPGWQAIWGPTQYGIPLANRNEVAPSASTGAVVYIRPRFIGAASVTRSTGAVFRVKPRFAASTNATAASTGAVVYFRPRFVGNAYPTARSTGAVVNYSVRVLSGIWTTSTVPVSNLDNLRSLLPPQRNKAVNTDLTYAADLYRFLDYLVNVYLGGPDAPTINDIVASLEDTIHRATTAAVQAALAQQQSQANAEALAATIQVVQNNSLTGADQIPPAQTTMEA